MSDHLRLLIHDSRHPELLHCLTTPAEKPNCFTNPSRLRLHSSFSTAFTDWDSDRIFSAQQFLLSVLFRHFFLLRFRVVD